MNAITFDNVSEKYRIKFIEGDKVSWEEVWALEDLTLNISKGEVLGIIGPNGAGKTTLLKLISGMLVPDKGGVTVDGRVSVLMELGAGFNPEFTGRENIMLNARVYGMDEEALEHGMPVILEFANLGRFIDAPIRYYSQGMYMRLAFALAIFVDPDILLIDDILSVGDEEAQQKCIKKVFELKQAGKTIVIVSHDMNMISQLCGRVVLLKKGKLIKEGLPQKIISYYFEEIGNKDGIAVIEKDKLRLVFNNGRVSLAYNDSFLTKGLGGYVSFFNPAHNSWYSSPDLSWKTKDFGPGRFVAEGYLPQGGACQTWSVCIQGKKIKCEIRINDCRIQEPHASLLLAASHNRWFTQDKEGVFPEFSHQSRWQDLGIDSFPNGMLGLGLKEETDNPAGLILNIICVDNQVRVLNTGYTQESRVVQIHPNSDNSIVFEIEVFPEKDKFAEYIEGERAKFRAEQERKRLKEEQERLAEEERKRLKEEQERLAEEERKRLREEQERLAEEERRQLEEERLRLERNMVSGSFRLFVDEDNKIVRIYYKEKEITRGKGLYSAIRVKEAGTWFHSFEADWKINRISPNELELSLSYGSLSLVKIWRFRWEEEGVLKNEIVMLSARPVFLSNRDVRLEISREYEDLQTAYEKVDLAHNNSLNTIVPVRLQYERASQVILSQGSKSVIPQLCLESSFRNGERLLGVFKKEEVLCINSSQIIPRSDVAVPSGTHDYFEGKIILGKGLQLHKEDRQLKSHELHQDSLKLVFDNGRVGVFWKGKELTAGLGMYTSVRSSGIWHDSFRAFWEPVEMEKDRIVVSGSWSYMPISQTWEIRLRESGSIHWKVDMDVHEETELELIQANLMISPEYKHWLIPGKQKGVFLEEFTLDYDILPFRFWYGNTEGQGIGATGEYLPDVVFKSFCEKISRGIIENTDYLYRARLLQFQEIGSGKISPKQYAYFEGAIEIRDKERL